MPSKWCPKCGRITSVTGSPNFCAWGCGSLADEPLLPPYSEWVNGYSGMVEYARRLWKEQQEKIKIPEPVDIGDGRLQMRLF